MTKDTVYTLCKIGEYRTLLASNTLQGITQYITHLKKDDFKIDVYEWGLYSKTLYYQASSKDWE